MSEAAYRGCRNPDRGAPTGVASGRKKRTSHEGDEMDLIVLAIIVAFFVISGALVGLLGRL